MSTTANLAFFDNEDWVINVTYKDSAGVVINITGAAIFWETTDGVVASTGNGRITIINGTAGQAKIDVPKGAVSSIGRYRHESKMTPSGGGERVYFSGALDVLKGIGA